LIDLVAFIEKREKKNRAFHDRTQAGRFDPPVARKTTMEEIRFALSVLMPGANLSALNPSTQSR